MHLQGGIVSILEIFPPPRVSAGNPKKLALHSGLELEQILVL